MIFTDALDDLCNSLKLLLYVEFYRILTDKLRTRMQSKIIIISGKSQRQSGVRFAIVIVIVIVMAKPVPKPTRDNLENSWQFTICT